MELTILPAAERFIQRMVRFGGGDGCGFRLVVTPGGCSGLNSEFSVEPAPRDGDVIVEQPGLRLFLPPASATLLAGGSIDFTDTATQSGLVFQTREGNPCACSSSAGATASGVAAVALGAIERRVAPAAES
ncbi:MAG: HesB/IscA family protein [Porticoccaceae bacterium]